MEYVEVINNGLSYTTLLRQNNSGEFKAEDFGITNYARGTLPIRGRTYMVIKRVYDFFDEPLMSIADSNGDEFIIQTRGVRELDAIPKQSDIINREMEWGVRKFSDLDEKMEFHKQQIKIRNNNPLDDNYVDPFPVVAPNVKDAGLSIGDIVIIADHNAPQFGRTLEIFGINRSGFPYVCGTVGSGRIQWGYSGKQLEKVIKTPEIPDDDKPQFSKNELLEVLNQEKSFEQIFLDIMDHITN